MVPRRANSVCDPVTSGRKGVSSGEGHMKVAYAVDMRQGTGKCWMRYYGTQVTGNFLVVTNPTTKAAGFGVL